MKKVIKTTTTRTVIPSVSDTLSLDGGGSVTGIGGYTTPMGFRQGPGAGAPMDYPTNTVPRNYHYGPPVGYNDYRTGPPPDAYASLNRSTHMDDRYRFVDFSCVYLASMSHRAWGKITWLLIPSQPADLSIQSTQMVTELWIRATGLTAGASWIRMLLSLRWVLPRQPTLILFTLFLTGFQTLSSLLHVNGSVCFSLCRSGVWEVHWSCPPSPDLSQTRTGWRMISAAWVLMNLIMDWDTHCTLVPFPVTITLSPMGHHGGPGRTSDFLKWDLCSQRESTTRYWLYVWEIIHFCTYGMFTVCVYMSFFFFLWLFHSWTSSSGVMRAPWMVTWVVQVICITGEERHWPRGNEAAWLPWTAPYGKDQALVAGVNPSSQRSSPCSTTGWSLSGVMQLHTCSISPIKMIRSELDSCRFCPTYIKNNLEFEVRMTPLKDDQSVGE